MKKINTKTTSLFAVTLAALLVTGCLEEKPKDDDNNDNGDQNTEEPDFYEEKGWQLVFADEFDGTVIDDSKWAFEVNCWGGGNNEKQCYVDDPDNAFVEDGKLHIKAIRENYTGAVHNPDSAEYDPAVTQTQPFTSARLRSVAPNAYVKGEDTSFSFKNDWKYGRFEIRAKLPSGQGTWPAVWMLPTDWEFGGWAMSGEIDIMEAVNLKADRDLSAEDNGETGIIPENRVHGTLHYGRAWPGNVYTGVDYDFGDVTLNPADDFHTYAVEWEEGAIRWFVDDIHVSTQTQEGWYTHYQDESGVWQTSGTTAAPFNQKFHLIMNLAMGGAWAGNVNEGGIDDSINEAEMVVDFVRVYQCEDDASGVACGTKGEEGTYTLQSGVVEPMLPVAADFTADPLVIFNDLLVADWQMAKWDDTDGGDEYSVVEPTESSDGYIDLQFSNTGVMYLYSNEGKLDDFSNYAGDYSFKMRWVDGTATGLKVGFNDNKGNFAHIVLDQQYFGATGSNDWTTVTIPVVDMVTNAPSIDLKNINIAGKFEQVGGTDLHVQVKDIAISKGRLPASLTLFSDTENPDWVFWDCCAGSTPSVVTDANAAYGEVAQFDINGDTVVGFSARAAVGATGDKLFDASNGSTLEFDLKMITAPTAGSTDWRLKLESKGSATAADVSLSTSVEGNVPEVGVWQHYTFNIADLKAAGLDLSQIDLVMIFPAWGTGAGASFYVDNVKFFGGNEKANVSYDPTSGALTLYDDQVTATWPLYDCCNNATENVVADADATFGNVAEFEIFADTVVGFSSRSTGATHDATSNTNVEFDIKLINAPTDNTAGWYIKVESNGGASAVEVTFTDPAIDTWQHVSVPLSSFTGLDLTTIDSVLIFPQWGKGAGAKYRVDNVEFN